MDAETVELSTVDLHSKWNVSPKQGSMHVTGVSTPSFSHMHGFASVVLRCASLVQIGMYLNNPSPAMDWSFGCTASPILISHFVPLDLWRRTLGGVVASFVMLVTFLVYVLMRWHNTIFLERLQKNASIAQMDLAIREAEMARDQKTDFMAFLASYTCTCPLPRAFVCLALRCSLHPCCSLCVHALSAMNCAILCMQSCP